MKLTEVYKDAIKNGYSLGAFNFYNLESLTAILDAGQKNSNPIIVSVSESAFEYMGFNMLKQLIVGARQNYTFPFFVHLDHGKSLDMCKKAIDCGFDSVMIDGSHLPLEDNIALTKSVVDYAHKFNVQVEGELGKLKGVEDNVSSNEHLFTDPMEAKQFVSATNVDSLAIAIGTSHGINKFSGKPELRLDILSEIQKVLPNTPLVLHGASSINADSVNKLNSLGATIKKAIGIPEDVLKNVSSNYNIVKINVDSDIRIETTLAIKKYLTENTSEVDPRKYLKEVKKQITNLVEYKINNVFNTKSF